MEELYLFNRREHLQSQLDIRQKNLFQQLLLQGQSMGQGWIAGLAGWTPLKAQRMASGIWWNLKCSNFLLPSITHHKNYVGLSWSPLTFSSIRPSSGFCSHRLDSWPDQADWNRWNGNESKTQVNLEVKHWGEIRRNKYLPCIQAGDSYQSTDCPCSPMGADVWSRRSWENRS